MVGLFVFIVNQIKLYFSEFFVFFSSLIGIIQPVAHLADPFFFFSC